MRLTPADPFTDDPDRACLGIPTIMFFPDDGDRLAADDAKRVCRRCPIIDACREWAIETHQAGVWGGTTDRERDQERARRNRQIAVKPPRNRPARQRRAEVARLTAAGWGTAAIAAGLGITGRSVERHRAAARRAA